MIFPKQSRKNILTAVDQIEGVHCKGSCTIENVWWVDVCEDALSLKGDGNAMVKGGGAQSASDKVVQHNGKGVVTIDGFQVADFGKLYRACGNCKNSVSRSVVIKNVKVCSSLLPAQGEQIINDVTGQLWQASCWYQPQLRWHCHYLRHLRFRRQGDLRGVQGHHPRKRAQVCLQGPLQQLQVHRFGHQVLLEG